MAGSPPPHENRAFDTLLALADQATRHARGLPAQVDIQPHWSGIGFSLNGCSVVAPMGEIVELLPVPTATRLPGVRHWVRGVANVRGRLLPLIDLEAWFGGSLGGPRARHRVLVLERGELYVGLIVSQVHGMQHFPVDHFTTDLPPALGRVADYVSGGYRQRGEVWAVLDPGRLAEDHRFINAAA